MWLLNWKIGSDQLHHNKEYQELYWHIHVHHYILVKICSIRDAVLFNSYPGIENVSNSYQQNHYHYLAYMYMYMYKYKYGQC